MTEREISHSAIRQRKRETKTLVRDKETTNSTKPYPKRAELTTEEDGIQDTNTVYNIEHVPNTILGYPTQKV